MSKIFIPKPTNVIANTSERLENDEGLKTLNEDQIPKPSFLFSIDYILNKAGGRTAEADTAKQSIQQYDWLLCSRYEPPKINRIKNTDVKHKQKRKLERNPRIPFTSQQISILEEEFSRTAYLAGTNELPILAEMLQLSESRIKVWFQNRRARERRENHSIPRPSSTITTAQQNQLPISHTSAFKPLPPIYAYVENNDLPLPTNPTSPLNFPSDFHCTS